MDEFVTVVPYWVKREKRGKWHLAESWVAGDAVTYCGRRMRDGQTADGVLITLALTPRFRTACAVCWGAPRIQES